MDVKNRVAIVGAGLIGRSWAIVFAGGAFDVALYDVAPDIAEQARGLVAQGLSDLAEQGLLDDPKAAAARVRLAANLADALDGVGLVQESLPESIETKRAIFSELDRLAAPDAILASSTSTIVANLFTQSLKGRHRCLVAHPVNPPHLIPLVELVGAPWTSPAIIAKAMAIYAAVGQAPIIVKREIEGFVLNRLHAVLLSEAFRLVGDGYVTPMSALWCEPERVERGKSRDLRRREPRAYPLAVGEGLNTRSSCYAHALARSSPRCAQGASGLATCWLIVCCSCPIDARRVSWYPPSPHSGGTIPSSLHELGGATAPSPGVEPVRRSALSRAGSGCIAT